MSLVALRSPAVVRAAGIAVGVLVDAAVGDPRRGHPVAGFGRLATALEGALYRPDRGRGVAFTGLLVGGATGAGWVLERWASRRPPLHLAVVAAATWAALGTRSLAAAGSSMAAALEQNDLTEARHMLGHLCARDAAALGPDELARATVESLAENTSDAAVAPLLWAGAAGAAGVLGYRAANTLDAMVGYRSPRYRDFGWASARLDDVVNLAPARVTGVLTVLAAPAVGGSRRAAWTVLRRDGAAHPSPNAGRCEAAAAGALGVKLGGTNVYGGEAEHRPQMGDGPSAGVSDVRRAVRLGRVVAAGSAVLAVVAPVAVRVAVSGRAS